MLAFEDKDALVREIAAALPPGGRLAFTLEEGPPLTTAERAAMPDADTVWLTTLDAMAASLERAGLAVTWQEDHSRAHLATARALTDAFAADARGHRRADRPPGAGRAARRPSAVDRMAGRGAGPEARAGGGARLALGRAERQGASAAQAVHPQPSPVLGGGHVADVVAGELVSAVQEQRCRECARHVDRPGWRDRLDPGGATHVRAGEPGDAPDRVERRQDRAKVCSEPERQMFRQVRRAQVHRCHRLLQLEGTGCRGDSVVEHDVQGVTPRVHAGHALRPVEHASERRDDRVVEPGVLLVRELREAR